MQWRYSVLVTAILAVALSWTGVTSSRAQGNKDWRTAPFIDHTTSTTGPIRGFHGKNRPIERSFKSDPEANAVFARVLEAAGRPELTDRIIFRASAEASNAFADNKKEVGPVIFYNPAFMQGLHSDTGNYWSMIAVVAHEVGHHILLHPATLGRDHEFELEADRLAGKILATMCANWADTKAAYEQFDEAATESHPPRSQRLAVLALGWREGKCAGGPVAGSQNAAPVPKQDSEADRLKREAAERDVREAKARQEAEKARLAALAEQEAAKVTAAEKAKAEAKALSETAREQAAMAATKMRVLTHDIQRELQRVGCSPGSPDGTWGVNSKRAADKFVELAKLSLRTEVPSAELLNALNLAQEAVCLLAKPEEITTGPGRGGVHATSSAKPEKPEKPASGKGVGGSCPSFGGLPAGFTCIDGAGRTCRAEYGNRVCY